MWESKRVQARRRRAASFTAVVPGIEWKFPAAAAKELQEKVIGKVVLPSDNDYHLVRQAFVANFQGYPQIIVSCEVFNDVAWALDFAWRYGLSPVCRSGGHSAAGHSVNDEMVIDLSRLEYVVVDPVKQLAVVGAGTTIGQLDAALDGYQLHVPGGACDDVAVAGFMQGGGFGYTSQIYGMNCDNVVEVLVMLADGSIVAASAQSNPDLFWALRGGTGNNFGVVLQITYRLHRPGPLWGFGIIWKLDDCAADLPKALEVLQHEYTGPNTPKGMSHQSTFNFVGKDRYFMLRGMYQGRPADGKKALRALLKTKGAKLDVDHTDHYKDLQVHLNTSPEAPVFAPHSRTVADSRYIARPVSRDEWQGIVELFHTSPNRTNFIGLEAYGGPMIRPEPHDTAFRHRDASFDAYIWVLWQNAEQRENSLKFLGAFRDTLSACSNGHAYQNYPNRDNKHYRWMYWGDNFYGLLKVKDKYDPDRLFCFGHCISPPAKDEWCGPWNPMTAHGPAVPPQIDRLVAPRFPRRRKGR
jgi:FAD/FMN-containing dehydrogenase